MVIERDFSSIRVIILNHENKHNPFSESLENSIKKSLIKADQDDNVKAIVVYGGENRSFSSGGDFSEVKNLSGESVERWIDRVIDLYCAVLNVNKPTVAAVDGYAIGMGFQFSLMFDQRIVSSEAKFIMPELKHGIGCSVGAAILSFTHGHNIMKKIVFECEEISSEMCIEYNIANQVIDKEILLETAIERANLLATYPKTAYLNTKKFMNKKFVDILEDSRKESKLVHKNSFGSRDSQKHFKKVLGEKY
ncbi:enoyl-CoA hydratase/isomerase family protein [Photorhabdus laumondii subsp. laumondii]|uniref:CpmB protein involved in carbapenem biosynthesis n=3 Tax=Photorhabdus TaxID=29487 RepID=F5HGP5_PHOLL|nr:MULTISPECIES: carboxymethylproline synthase [Photorhabdus]AWK40178.1 spore coat protein CotG [Photorhabdus laumondii subsp. laumondii]AXG41016.1 enoyl-CoA hydratase/isomerase family protein [Photorhabdus laumondii subsp. laumondii]AXG45528.1 enoyl-CoA hydratase/isomerase family protein [Photorhabdus laumondii subsp. laumondii]KTL59557.1 spore coat protein CotG [Photorhabdus laumondii subsp. laumondii]MBS9423611.1 enoyl-CoA hydratase/isomerase family protein [Photorhabdus caribbeanensis]